MPRSQVPQDAILYQGTKGVPSGTDNLGDFIYLPPREVVDVRMVFKPPKPNDRVHRADISMAGNLRVTYQNGDVQVGLESGLSGHWGYEQMPWYLAPTM